MSAVRPIHIPGETALEALQLRVRAALDSWALEWVSGWSQGDARAEKLRISLALDEPRPVPAEFEPIFGASGCLWFRNGVGQKSKFGRAVVGTELTPAYLCEDEWVTYIVESAWTARNDALRAALLGGAIPTAQSPAQPSMIASLFAAGSGAVRMSCEALGLDAFADGAVWNRTTGRNAPAKPRTPLTPLDQASRRANARLDVILGSVEIELPKLMDLRCGDVLCLPQRLDQGITLLCQGNALARVALGEQQGRKCVQVLGSNPFPSTRVSS